MSALHRLNGHEKDLGGGFKVRRVLPAAQQRSVGPFIFFDHFGPVTELPGTDHDVRAHPHIGLATVTYLFEGAMMHRDSLGTEQLIEPGAINWMTAGRGIVHSERRPEHLKDKSFVSHGLQLWCALPLADEETDPSFSHTAARDIPEVRRGGANVRVLIGEAFGVRSPVPALGETLYLDIAMPAGASLVLPALAQQRAVYAVDNRLHVNDEAVDARVMAVLPPGEVTLQAPEGARLVVVGGPPLDAPRHMWWNFVSSRKDRIIQASADWEAQRMRHVPGETEFIPLPPTRFTPAEPRS